MMLNRVLRYFEKPAGVYHGSVFVQLSGGIGPSAIVSDRNGTLYVAQYDLRGTPSLPSVLPSPEILCPDLFLESSAEGIVFVIGKDGQIQSQITVGGSEITGLAIK